MTPPPATVPYGYCHCGCGNETRLAPYTAKRLGYVRGKPIRFIHNHHLAGRPQRLRLEMARREYLETGMIVEASAHHQVSRENLKQFILDSGGKVISSAEHSRRTFAVMSPENKAVRTRGLSLGPLHQKRGPRVNVLTATNPGHGKYRRASLFALADKFGWVCWYCNMELDGAEIHLDHIVPRSKGGPNDLSNLALSCSFCNRAKANSDVDIYLLWLDRVRNVSTWTPIRGGRRPC